MPKGFGSHIRHKLVAWVALFIVLCVALLVAFADVAHSAFPGQNGLIAFQSFRDNSFRSDIHVINPDGTGQLNVTNFPSGHDFSPAWSPDGAQLAFVSNRFSNGDIFRMAADGTGLTRLTNDSTSRGPAWSPSGTRIAFTTNGVASDEVFSMSAADGSEQVNLTATGHGSNTGPAWSSDGTRIAFTSNRTGNREIFVMIADGTSQVNLTEHPALDSDADWSPDDTRIVFSSNRDSTLSSEVYIMNADGTNQIRLTNNAGFDGHPTWSPDGTKIAFTSNRLGNDDIYTMNPDGSEVTRVTTNEARDQDPSWQPVFPGPEPTPTATPEPTPTATPQPTDTSDPTIAITSPLDAAHYLLGSSLVADFACTDEDGGSGLVTCTGSVASGTSLDTSTVGPRDFTVTATDNAGNDASLTHDYRIVYPFGGFQAPVDGQPTINTAKAGPAIPVNFTLGNDYGLGILAPGSPSSTRFDCGTAADLDEIEETDSVGSGLSYDPDTGAYKYKWKTSKSWAGTCRAFDLELSDGTHHQALFSFR